MCAFFFFVLKLFLVAISHQLFCSTNPMQTLLPNARVLFDYTDGGASDSLDLIPPQNFWSMTAYGGQYYDYERDWFCLPATPPPQIKLGDDCNAMVYSFTVTSNRTMRSVMLETLSLEVVIGLMGVSVMTP
jgi:hypothetical protein